MQLRQRLILVLSLYIACSGLRAAENPASAVAGQTATNSATEAIETRVHLFPLLYINRDEILVLGGIFRKTTDSFAIRPFFAYDWSKKRLRFLYPLVELKEKGGNWVLPFFWDEGHLVGFPFYWSFRSPEERLNTLLPLWWYMREPSALKWWALAGLMGGSSSATSSHHRVLPLYSWSRDANGQSGWMAWPLGRIWSDNRKNESGSMLLPLWYKSRKEKDETLITPLWANWSHDGGRTEGRAIIPFAAWEKEGADFSIWSLFGAYTRQGESTKWWWWPLLSSGVDSVTMRNRWWLFPFVRSRDDEQGRYRHVAPFYLYRKNAESETLLTPVYARKQQGEKVWSAIPPLLSWAVKGADYSERWIVAPLAHFRKSGQEMARHVFPLFYQRLGADRSVWATLLGGRIVTRDSQTNMVYPLLTWWTTGANRQDFWTLAPLVHWSSGSQRGSRHIAGLFYENPLTKSFYSLPYIRMQMGENHWLRVVPPALSWWTHRGGALHGRVLLGLGGFGGFEGNRYSYLYPFFYRNQATDSLLTPLYARWTQTGGAKADAIPPLLSWRTRDETSSATHALAGLTGWGRDGLGRWSYLFPAYFKDSMGNFATPIAGRLNLDDGVFRYFATPLVGTIRGVSKGGWVFPLSFWRENQASGDKSLWILWAHWWKHGEDKGSGMFPFWRHYVKYSESGSTRHLQETRNIAFVSRYNRHATVDASGTPLVSSSSYRLWPLLRRTESLNEQTKSSQKRFSALLGLFRSDRKMEAGKLVAETRHWLWYLYRYEREGERVRADIFPSITYDRAEDGREKTTFLWFVYQRERAVDGSVRRRVFGIPF